MDTGQAETKKAPLIYKGGDKDSQNAKSYRPVCLLNIQGKIMEEAIHARLYSYLEKLRKPHPKQYGYKRGNPRWMH
jgi:hypothetical protein